MWDITGLIDFTAWSVPCICQSICTWQVNCSFLEVCMVFCLFLFSKINESKWILGLETEREERMWRVKKKGDGKDGEGWKRSEIPVSKIFRHCAPPFLFIWVSLVIVGTRQRQYSELPSEQWGGTTDEQASAGSSLPTTRWMLYSWGWNSPASEFNKTFLSILVYHICILLFNLMSCCTDKCSLSQITWLWEKMPAQGGFDWSHAPSQLLLWCFLKAKLEPATSYSTSFFSTGTIYSLQSNIYKNMATALQWWLQCFTWIVSMLWGGCDRFHESGPPDKH